jgi:hypothetical protein
MANPIKAKDMNVVDHVKGKGIREKTLEEQCKTRK